MRNAEKSAQESSRCAVYLARRLIMAASLAVLAGCAAQPTYVELPYLAPETAGKCPGGTTLVCHANSLSALKHMPPSACECQFLPRTTRPPQPARFKRRGARH